MDDKLKKLLIVQWLRFENNRIDSFKVAMTAEQHIAPEVIDLFLLEVKPEKLLPLKERYDAIAYRLANEVIKGCSK